MKRFKIVVLCLLLPILTIAQEFRGGDKQFMYDSTTMNALIFIVDSLNIQHKQCGIVPNYTSIPQSIGTVISLDDENADLKKARKALKEGMSMANFRKEFPKADIKTYQLIVAFDYKYEGKKTTEIKSIPADGSYEKSLAFSSKDLKKDQLLFYNESDGYLNAFVLFYPLAQKAIPVEHAYSIQYADCMIDTSASIYRAGASRRSWWDEDETPKAMNQFMKTVNRGLKAPEYKDENQNFDSLYTVWLKKRVRKMDKQFFEPKVQFQMNKAYEAALKAKVSNDDFEFFVERYLGKEKALELKRNRVVVGGCSMDDSPRVHMKNIASLSAKTAKWEIFLRAHLNIMNDYFSRVSDGSYAYGRRETYYNELEALNIEALDLLIGISLRFQNSNEGHYFGSIGRIGRAFAESNKKKEVEERFSLLIEDDGLDDFNRMLICFLHLNYIYYIEDEIERKAALDSLYESVLTLPDYLSEPMQGRLKEFKKKEGI